MDENYFMEKLDKYFQDTYERWLRNKPILMNAFDIEKLCKEFIVWKASHSNEEKLNGSD